MALNYFVLLRVISWIVLPNLRQEPVSIEQHAPQNLLLNPGAIEYALKIVLVLSVNSVGCPAGAGIV
jgi:hypothetical protein